MRRVVLFLFALFATAAGLCAADVDVSGKQLPKFRPALPGSGPDSIVNRIDTKDLINKGQKTGLIMFSCSVSKTGEVRGSEAFRGTEETKILEDEVLKRLTNAKFVPAVFDYQPVDAVFYGTVVFANTNGKPRLRIFCNQEIDEIKKESDFISPQPVSGRGSAFTGFHYPSQKMPVVVDATVQVTVDVDATGNLTVARIVLEEPPLIGFGEATVRDLDGAKFVPAFRAGKPVESSTTITIFHRAES